MEPHLTIANDLCTPDAVETDDSTAIALFYCYTPIPDPKAVVAWQEELTARLGLVGRIRVAPEGINVTLGGDKEQVLQYCKEVQEYPCFRDTPIDFKIGPGCRERPHFYKHSVRLCRELVTLGAPSEQSRIEDTGVHLEPAQFHEHLSRFDPESMVLIDTRNNYEWKIGSFVHADKPNVRQFSDFPAYVAANAERYAQKDVYMYCTGGVRCERASAYVKSQGAKNVYQLKGGIVRYLEQYSQDGGLFQGQCLMFDNRGAVSAQQPVRVGRCEFCNCEFDSYEKKPRCTQCRILILACDTCAESPHLCQDCQGGDAA
eukprot:TRINITY_DN40488_c0_g1_i1.p1 TRINITY_DN40488_c0_g1~~TRINITY_DN40488_c0_g1_i1.p1  ORF type:complete len:316 (-),score=36.44 TRINITY_DN40488_c0_g1_i1:476-1423(-)